MKTIQLTLVKAEGIFLEKSVSTIRLPAFGGVIEILPEHEAMIVGLKKGDIIVDQEKYPIEGGFAMVNGSHCRILLTL